MKKPNLTPGERIKVAYFYTFKGISQADLADILTMGDCYDAADALKGIEHGG